MNWLWELVIMWRLADLFLTGEASASAPLELARLRSVLVMLIGKLIVVVDVLSWRVSKTD